MNFQRFGNAFVAVHEDTLYVVTLYLGSWQAYYRDQNMLNPEKIGLYGYPTPEEASQAVEVFTSTLGNE